jgi:3-oxoacyl-[acyl-carrier-protein] synthase-3
VRFDDMYIRATGVRLPAFLPVADAVAAGDFPRGQAVAADMASVSWSPAESPAEMAVAAARTALERTDSGPQDVRLILHAASYHQGHEMWAVASYLQRETLRNTCPAIEVRQMSNGGMAALELATAYLTSPGRRGDALLTTADRFCPPGMDRWRADPGTPFADGGTALVLSRRGGVARLRSLALLADSELEELHRGDTAFSAVPFADGRPLDFEEPARAFVKKYGMGFTVTRAHAGQQTVIKQALADADMELAEADHVLLPHFGKRRLQAIFYRPFGIDPGRTTWEWSRTVGHLGAGDQFAGLDRLLVSGRARPGDRVVLLGVGAGYSWGCAVVEILRQPAWSG